MRIQRRVLAALLVVGLVGLGACGSGGRNPTEAAARPASATSGSSKPIVLGVPAFTSGLFGPQGEAWTHGIQAWAKAVNKSGINGRQVELKIEDTAFDPSKAIPVAQSLMDNHVTAIVGTMDSSFVAGARQLLQQEQIPVIGTSGASATEYGFKNIFPLGAPVAVMGHLQAEYAYKQLGARNAALVCLEAGGLGPNFCDAFTRVFEKLGGKIVHRQNVPPTFADQASFLVVAKDKGADLFAGFYGDIAPWIQGMKSIQWTPKAGIVTGAGTYDSLAKLASSGEPILEKVYTPTPGNPLPTSDSLVQYRKDLQAAFPGDTSGAYSVIGWLSGKVFEAAVKKSGAADLTSAALVKAVRQLGALDTGVGVTFHLDAQVPNQGVAVVTVRNGTLTEVQPWKSDPYLDGLER